MSDGPSDLAQEQERRWREGQAAKSVVKQPAVLVGMGIGDALGMPFEKPRDELHPLLEGWTGEYLDGTYHKIPAGRWTDDTEMAVALTETLLANPGFEQGLVAHAYMEWSKAAPTGMGSTTRKAMDALIAGTDPTLSGIRFAPDEWAKVGNGTAMRIAPLGVLFHYAYQFESLAFCAREDAGITHLHPEADAASIAVAFGVSAACRDDLGGEELLRRTIRSLGPGRSVVGGFPPIPTHVADNLVKALALLDANVSPDEAIAQLGRRGNAVQTVASAFYCAARFPDDFRAGVCAAVRGGGDTDTRAAITGALLGARLGLDGIPQSYRYGLHQHGYLTSLDKKLWDKRLKEGA